MSRISLVMAGFVLAVGPACSAETGDRRSPVPEAPVPTHAGSTACGDCHAEEAHAWSASAHGMTGTFLARPDGGADGAVGTHWMQAYYYADRRGLHAIHPLCYDLRVKAWRDVPAVLEEIIGPPIEPSAPALLGIEGRTFEADCAGCHVTGARHRIDVVTGRMVSRRLEASIGCEACHGAGAAHVEAWRSLAPGKPMARLSDLSPRAKTGVCARCHGGAVTEADATPDDVAHIVGTLDDRRGVFPDGRAAGQVYQYPSFVRSPCYREGGLSCTDCHDAHGPDRGGAAGSDARCVGCHAGKAAPSHTFHEAASAGSRCVECHMPRLLSGLTAHQRDHRISVPMPELAVVPDACTACHKERTKEWAIGAVRERWGESSRATFDAVRGVALARVGSDAAPPLLRAAIAHPDPFFRAAAIRIIGDPTLGADDPVPEVRLAALNVVARMPARREQLTRFLGDAEPVIRARALVELAIDGVAPDLASREDVALAVRLTRGWAAGNFVLGRMRAASNEFPGAVDALLAAVTYDPSLDGAWVGLASALEATGRPAEALASRELRASLLAERLRSRPGTAELVEATIDAYLEAGRPDVARRVLASAVETSYGASRERLLRRQRLLGGPVARPSAERGP